MRIIYALFILAICVLFSKFSFAQTGEIKGKVMDSVTHAGLGYAGVEADKNGSAVGTALCDGDGNYVIKPLDPGTYTIKATTTGYGKVIITGIQVTADNITNKDIYLPPGVHLKPVIISSTPPLVDPGTTQSGSITTAEQVKDLAGDHSISAIVSQTADVTQTDAGKALHIGGGRTQNAQYIVNGIPMPYGYSPTVPQSSIEQVEVVTGGVPAKYGDVTSGVIDITTKGPSKDFNGGINYETSEGLDPFGYNLGAFNLSGPVLTKYKHTDSSQTKIGFFVAGQVETARNGSFGDGGNTPPAFSIYTVKPGELTYLQNNPLQPAPNGFGFVPSAESLTPADLETSDYKLGAPSTVYTFDGTLNFQFTKNLLLSVGGSVDYQDFYNYSFQDQLLNSGNQIKYSIGTYRANAKFTQLFNNTVDTKGNSVSVFQNAYYSVQVDYSDEYESYQDAVDGSNIFDYGYVGKFQSYITPTYAYGYDSVSKKTAWIETSADEDTLIKFTPGTVNPLLTNYTKQYFALAGNNSALYYSNLDQIPSLGGLLNGQSPNQVYNLWNDVGSPEGYYGYENKSQIHLNVSGSVDIVNPRVKDKKKDKGRHAVEFGIDYKQQENRAYELIPGALWGLMRDLTNPANLVLDKNNPIYKNDTIKYKTVFNAKADSSLIDPNFFDQQLRQKLGLQPTNGEVQPIYIDELSPSTFNLNMFSADELANNGAFTEYAYGYNYLGQAFSTQPKYDDFFTQKDANGNYTRNNPAFTPNVAGAYIQDKFYLNDILFNVGVRVDRFDADQEQLIDPYLLYPARTAGEVTQFPNGQPVSIPGNIGSNYYVYVNDATAPTKILGYRNGNQWYLANGQETSDPTDLIAQASNSGTIQPWLVANTPYPAITGSSFTNTTPTIEVMPRIAFSFPISDQILFFAHYDVLTENPTDFGASTLSGDDVDASPFQYYYLRQLTTDYQIANPALKPQETIDYQVGYEQELGKNSAISISLLYKDLEDMVQLERIVDAYPDDYTTFGNVDFGNVKSLLVSYTMKRTKNIAIELNYTLSFAEGTGSSITSSATQVGESDPNLQVITPFSYDQRHTITGDIDYRFGEGANYNGPTGKTLKAILQNFGVNFSGNVFSGTPYTQQSNAVPTVINGVNIRNIISGNINGARLPWSYRFNLKVDKAFVISKVAKSKNNANGRDIDCDVYVLITNLLNTANVLSVASYTGNPNDDGYLESALGKLYSSEQDFPSTFNNLYQIRVDNPDNYSQPRTIHVGLQMNF